MTTIAASRGGRLARDIHDPLRPRALAGRLRAVPVLLSHLSVALLGTGGVSAFRQILRDVLPEEEEAIMGAGVGGPDREVARVRAFLARIEEIYFSVEAEETYAGVLGGIPYLRQGWWDESSYGLRGSPGELLLLAITADHDAYDEGHRIALYEYLVSCGIPRRLLELIPWGGHTPAELHDRLDGGPFAVAAAYADWVHRSTGSLFLDTGGDDDPHFVAWTRENLESLAEQARETDEFNAAIAELTRRLDLDPVDGFARLLDEFLQEPGAVRAALAVAAIDDRWRDGEHGTAPYLEIPPSEHRAIPPGRLGRAYDSSPTGTTGRPPEAEPAGARRDPAIRSDRKEPADER
jgi:hypothetical protein